MTRTILIALLALSALLGCGGGAAVVRTADDAEAANEPPPRYGVALRFEDAAEAEDGTPYTRVSLVRITPQGERTVSELRTEAGACFHQPASGALIAARCWWAGEGARYEVRRAGDEIVALRAEVHEETGAGEPSEVARLEIPSEAELDVLAPGGTTPLP